MDSLIEPTPLSSQPSGQPGHRASSVRAYKQPSGEMLRGISDTLHSPRPSTVTQPTPVTVAFMRRYRKGLGEVPFLHATLAFHLASGYRTPTVIRNVVVVFPEITYRHNFE